MLQILTCNLQPANYTLRVFMLVHNILVTRASRNTLILSVSNCKEITQLTTFAALINTNYFLRPVARHRPLQSSQYDAFPSQAQDQCFTHLAKMRRNTVTYWTTADFTNRQETCSFIRLNDAFRKTLLQAAKKKSRKSTDLEKNKSITRADFK